jgi:maltose/maltodextrin transport system substrate-binding protein
MDALPRDPAARLMQAKRPALLGSQEAKRDASPTSPSRMAEAAKEASRHATPDARECIYLRRRRSNCSKSCFSSVIPHCMRDGILVLSALFLIPTNLFAWTNGELLVWLDSDRGQAIESIAEKFEKDFGIKVTVDTPQNIIDSFRIAAQVAKGPDILIWAHDKIGEWADAGLIAPVEVSHEFANKYFQKAWQAVLHNDRKWGYPIALETVTLIHNKRLLDDPPPTDLSQFIPISQQLKNKHPGIITILWDYTSAYYSWGILASAGGYVFGKKGTNYEVRDVGVATPGAVAGLSKIVALVRAGILPKRVDYSTTEELMGLGKLAMMISGPWAWSNLTKSKIDFDLSPVPGVNGNVGRPFVGVMVAYLNRSSPNQDLAKEFLERYALTQYGLTTMDQAKPIGIPARIELYDKMASSNALLRQLKICVDYGEVMPNVPQMGRFFSSVGAALEIATEGRASARKALLEAAASLQHE